MKSFIMIGLMLLSGFSKAASEASTIASYTKDLETQKFVAKCLVLEKKKCQELSLVHMKDNEVVATKTISPNGLHLFMYDLRLEVFNPERYAAWSVMGMPLHATLLVLLMGLGNDDRNLKPIEVLLLLPVAVAVDVVKLPFSLGAGASYFAYKTVKTRHLRQIKRKLMKGEHSDRTVVVKNKNVWDYLVLAFNQGQYQ